MDEGADTRTALISLHPEWAEAIFEGRKTVEFRRSVPAHGVSHFVVYVTKPVGHVGGYFTVSQVHSDTPSKLWERFGSRGCISRHRYRKYFKSAPVGYAIEIGRAVSLTNPIHLTELAGGISAPPQNFRYLSTSTFGALTGRC